MDERLIKHLISPLAMASSSCLERPNGETVFYEQREAGEGENPFSYLFSLGSYIKQRNLTEDEKIKVAEILLDCGADIKYTDIAGQNALHHTCYHNAAKLIHFLTSRGLNPNQGMAHNLLPLEICIDMLIPENCKALIEAGADVNKTGCHKYAPLELIVNKCNMYDKPFIISNKKLQTVGLEIFKMLADAGADLTHIGKLLFMAKENGNTMTAKYLREIGAENAEYFAEIAKKKAKEDKKAKYVKDFEQFLRNLHASAWLLKDIMKKIHNKKEAIELQKFINRFMTKQRTEGDLIEAIYAFQEGKTTEEEIIEKCYDEPIRISDRFKTPNGKKLKKILKKICNNKLYCRGVIGSLDTQDRMAKMLDYLKDKDENADQLEILHVASDIALDKR